MRSLRPLLLSLFLLAPVEFVNAQDAPPPQTAPSPQDGSAPVEDHHKLVDLIGVEWAGTRLPSESLMRISGLKVGQKVNYDILNQVADKLTSTGLVSTVDYAYNVQPGKPGVMVSFKLSDEMPLLPASIYPAANEQLLWGCLESADPIFTHELPNTRNALKFYADNLDRCLEMGSHNHDFHAQATVACDAKGKAAKIVFNIREKEGTATAQR